MSVLLAAALAGACAAVLVALPSPGRLRFEALHEPARAPVVRRGPGVLLLAVPAVLVAGPVAGGLAALGLLTARHWQRVRATAAAEARERAGAVEACGALAGELRAGRDPAEALAAAAQVAVGAVARALAGASAAARLGGDVPGALLAERAPGGLQLLRALAACWTVCARSGSGLASAVERLEEGLRAEQAQRRAVDAELAGPRATAGLLAALPAFGLLMAAGLGADPLHVLLATPLGLVCLVLGLGLDALGVLWTQRLVARARGTG